VVDDRQQRREVPAAVEVVTLAGDLVHSLYGVHRDHIEWKGEQLDVNGGLGDGLQGGLVGFDVFSWTFLQFGGLKSFHSCPYDLRLE